MDVNNINLDSINIKAGWLGAVAEITKAINTLSEALTTESGIRADEVASLEKRLSKLEKSAS